MFARAVGTVVNAEEIMGTSLHRRSKHSRPDIATASEKSRAEDFDEPLIDVKDDKRTFLHSLVENREAYWKFIKAVEEEEIPKDEPDKVEKRTKDCECAVKEEKGDDESLTYSKTQELEEDAPVADIEINPGTCPASLTDALVDLTPHPGRLGKPSDEVNLFMGGGKIRIEEIEFILFDYLKWNPDDPVKVAVIQLGGEKAYEPRGKRSQKIQFVSFGKEATHEQIKALLEESDVAYFGGSVTGTFDNDYAKVGAEVLQRKFLASGKVMITSSASAIKMSLGGVKGIPNNGNVYNPNTLKIGQVFFSPHCHNQPQRLTNVPKIGKEQKINIACIDERTFLHFLIKDGDTYWKFLKATKEKGHDKTGVFFNYDNKKSPAQIIPDMENDSFRQTSQDCEGGDAKRRKYNKEGKDPTGLSNFN